MATTDTPDLTPEQDTLDLSKYFDNKPTGYDAFVKAYNPNVGLSKEMVDIAWRTKYGTDAPDWAEGNYGGSSGYKSGDVLKGVYDRIMSGTLAKMDRGGKGYDLSTREGQALQASAKALAKKEALDAVRPSAETLAGQYGEVGEAYQREREFLQGEKDPLAARYENLIEQIKGRQESAINRQTTATSNELGRRGISGGLAEQTLAQSVNPLETEFGSLLKDVGFEREKSLRDLVKQITDLTTQETSQKRAIRQAVADLISNTSLGGLQSGRQDYSQAAQQRIDLDRMSWEKEQQEIANRLAERAASLSEREFNEVTLPSSKKSSSSLADLAKSFGLF